MFYIKFYILIAPESRWLFKVVCERESLTHFVAKLPQYNMKNNATVSAMMFHVKHFFYVNLRQRVAVIHQRQLVQILHIFPAILEYFCPQFVMLVSSQF